MPPPPRGPESMSTEIPESQPAGVWQRIRSLFAPFLVAGALLFKLGSKLKFLLAGAKFLLPALKTVGSMGLTIAVYSQLWGWKYAAGFVLLILVHEWGHVLAARQCGLPVSAPVFIPFFGAFILLKQAPRDAWVEAKVALGGPLLGSAAALLCHLCGLAFHQPLLVALGWTGYTLNLFNLIPVGQLDGGRIVTAISPWLWIPGLLVLCGFLWMHPTMVILWLILPAALLRTFSLFRKNSGEDPRYYEVPAGKRLLVACTYFGLAAALGFGSLLRNP